MNALLAPLLRLNLDFGSGPARSLLTLAKQADYENVVSLVVRVVLVGAVITAVRTAASRFTAWLNRNLYPTAYIAVTDTSYLWVMAWLAQDPAAQSQIKDFQLSTSEWREVRQGSGNALHVETQRSGQVAPGSPTVGEHNASWSAKDIIGQVTPTYHQSIKIRHGNNHIWVTRKMGFFARAQHRTVDHIQIRTLAWQKTALKDFLSAAHHRYFTKQDQELLIFHPGRIAATWQKPVSRPARPWSSVVLPETVKESLLSDVEKFLSEKEISWYAARGIPHRRGFLFHGVPGSGKTTLATAIASKLHLNIYVINPSQRGMDDAKLSKLFRDCPARSIILIEDIFAEQSATASSLPIGDEGLLVTGEDPDSASPLDTPSDTHTHTTSPHTSAGSHDLAPSTVTLSGLLNAIDGVSSQEGCILIASTNHPEHLDPALRRAGRFDVQIPFFNATSDQAAGLFKHFYPLSDFTDTPDEKKQITSEAHLEELAMQFANATFPDATREQQDSAATKSAVQISMASLQGYLLGHKEDPVAAIHSARAWAEGHCERIVPRKVVLALAPAPAGKAKGAARKRSAAVPSTPISPSVPTPMLAGTV